MVGVQDGAARSFHTIRSMLPTYTVTVGAMLTQLELAGPMGTGSPAPSACWPFCPSSRSITGGLPPLGTPVDTQDSQDSIIIWGETGLQQGDSRQVPSQASQWPCTL
eukprot:2082837-Rhodomonas_salina.3